MFVFLGFCCHGETSLLNVRLYYEGPCIFVPVRMSPNATVCGVFCAYGRAETL